MPISVGRTFAVIFVVSACVFLTRALPFFCFPKGRPVPPVVRYLGGALPPAVIGMLVVYCLRSVHPALPPHGIPELISAALVVLLHRWKRNNLLSIGAGTLCYMFLVQAVFPQG